MVTARMIQVLDLQPGEDALEYGGGSGYGEDDSYGQSAGGYSAPARAAAAPRAPAPRPAAAPAAPAPAADAGGFGDMDDDIPF